MNHLNRVMVTAAVCAAALGFASRAQADDLVDTAAKAGSFKTLVAAVKAAGLVDALKADGPYTVFAPTDEAFARLPKGTVDNLLKPENKEKLKTILLYHVVKGKVLAADAMKLNGKHAGTLSGRSVKIKADKHGVYVNRSKVIKADVLAENGVIHVIDSVLIPK